METGKRTPAEVAADERRTGRPPVRNRAKVRACVLQVRLTAAELRAIHAEAKRRGMTATELLLAPFRRAGK
jgi:hypothetical protein